MARRWGHLTLGDQAAAFRSQKSETRDPAAPSKHQGPDSDTNQPSGQAVFKICFGFVPEVLLRRGNVGH